MIESVLIANRGEIALRVMRTCRRMGIRTIAVYSDADARATHVDFADEAVYIGASPPRESYLNVDRILDAAQATHAAAIHPGYGFLSENPDFAQRVIDSGLVWVGPPPAAMRALGDKARAKALAEQQDVPVLPGYHGADQSPVTLAEQARRIGLPILIKASAGGGGRGMRVSTSDAAFADDLEAARREALAAFGDDRVLLERYVDRPRHVEIQIVGDSSGNLIHLGERECSVQRRHQKLIEESPSPVVDADLRRRMGDAALRLARAAGYSSAGTVEFLLDEHGTFAFLEVNARLQVEHPVTEAITGLDLVELQLRVAAGERLPLSQSDLAFDGHAMEVRVIAEDALAAFLPSSGTITCFAFPDSVRVDTWIRDGTVVSPYYDSLLAKVIAHAPTRADTTELLASALEFARVDGVRHNLDLLLATLQTPAFRAGELTTQFLEEQRALEHLAEVPGQVLAAACALDHLRPAHAGDPWTAQTPWRMGRLDQPSTWSRAGREHVAVASVDPGEPRAHVRLGTMLYAAQLVGASRVDVDGESLTVDDVDDLRLVRFEGRSYRLKRPRPLSVDSVSGARGPASSGTLVAPMPGRIVKLAVEPGQEVNQNQPLIVLEAMKMEHVVEAPHAGKVSQVFVKAGDQVQNGAALITLGSLEAEVE